MSKWKDDFCRDFDNTEVVRKLNKEIEEERIKKGIDKALSDVIKGKYKRRLK